MIQVTLPYPPAALRPNKARTRHWASNGVVAAKYKANCIILCRAAGMRSTPGLRPHVTLRFYPPDKRRRDLDADLSASKAAIDAISDVLGVDDALFSFTLLRGEPVKDGWVEISIVEG